MQTSVDSAWRNALASNPSARALRFTAMEIAVRTTAWKCNTHLPNGVAVLSIMCLAARKLRAKRLDAATGLSSNVLTFLLYSSLHTSLC
eukprot:9473501-Pyramimonas_sp.AAC.1